jgi:ABC-type Na+ efflux pump permease subunit
MDTFTRRLVGASTLNPATYEEVEGDRSANAQALAVVLLSSIAAGIGARGFGASRPGDVLLFMGIALVAWIAWATLTCQIGIRALPTSQTQADIGQLLRTTGFASAPGIFRLFGLVPGLTAVVFIATAIWMLLAMLVAVRQALDYQATSRAVAVCLLGWLLVGSMAIILGVVFGPSLS